MTDTDTELVKRLEEQIEDAHTWLDYRCVPRTDGEKVLSLIGRFERLSKTDSDVTPSAISQEGSIAPAALREGEW